MEIVPITFREASDFINKYHRHHKATVGHKFSIGCYENDRLVVEWQKKWDTRKL